MGSFGANDHGEESGVCQITGHLCCASCRKGKKTEKRLMRDSTGSETPQKKRLCVLGENTTDDDDSDA